jgi:hypothetical protein
MVSTAVWHCLRGHFRARMEARKSLRNLMVPEAFPWVADEGFEPP